MKLLKRAILVFLMTLVIFAAYYLISSAAPDESALAVADQYSDLRQDEKGYITWTPDDPNGIGVIFYQGGKVEELAYAELLLPLLDEGYTIFLPQLPFNLAVFNADAAAKVVSEHGEINTWWIGGHSLGGAMAADYVFEHPGQMAGLFLLGAYPQEKKPLNDYSGQVVAIFGTKDGLVGTEGIDGWMSLLPKDSVRVMLEGANHAQFGSYGLQKGDLEADISSEDQKEQVRHILLEFLGQ
jgi:hypothetical protein